jgi:hypothetical protein
MSVSQPIKTNFKQIARVELKCIQYSEGDYILCMTSRYFFRSFTSCLLCELTASQLVAIATRSDTGSHNRVDLIQSLVPTRYVCNGYFPIRKWLYFFHSFGIISTAKVSCGKEITSYRKSVRCPLGDFWIE